MAKVRVNHSGACGEYSYQANTVFEVKGDDLADLKKSLGKDLTVLEEDKQADEPEKKEEVSKEFKPDYDKMIHNEKGGEKVVTK